MFPSRMVGCEQLLNSVTAYYNRSRNRKPIYAFEFESPWEEILQLLVVLQS
jgi:hypothetical protein